MGAKTCLLCGKALGRWSGAGEEFCSREHRNQYRLRRGMDRLLEANKVASVMRRRESPRQIPAANLISPGLQGPRAYLQPRQVPVQPTGGNFAPRIAEVFRPRLTAVAGALTPPALAGPEAGPKTPASTPLPFAPRPAGMNHTIAPKMPVHVQQAPVAPLSGCAISPEFRRRLLMSPWRASSSRAVVGDMLRRVGSPDINPIDAVRSARRIAAAARGRALRVSMGLGFRVPEWTLPQIVLAQPPAAGMTWPMMVNLVECALDRSRPEPISAAMDIATPAMCIPAAPPADFDGRFRWPEALEIPLHLVRPVVRHWTTVVPFGCAEDGIGKERLHEYRN